MEYVPLESILNYIPRVVKRESNREDLLSHALLALRELNIAQRYHTEMKIFEVINHKIDLPAGVSSIQLVTYMDSNPSNDDIEEYLCAEIKSCPSCKSELCKTSGMYWEGDSVFCDTCTNCLSEPYSYNERLCRPTLNYQLWLDSALYNNNFTLLRFTGNTKGLLCSDCPNLRCNGCSYSFSYSPSTNQLVFPDFRTGYICLAYYEEIKDEEGRYLIPKNSKLQQALATFALSKHWEVRAMAHEQGAQQMWLTLQTRAAIELKKARGSLLLAGINPEEIAQISFNKRYISNLIKLPELHKKGLL